MATEYKLSYTASTINEKLGKIDSLAEKSEIPTKTSELTNDSGFLTSIPDEYVTETELDDKGYLTEHQDLSLYALKTDIPSVPVTSVNNKTGDITLNASDVGALPNTTKIPTSTSELTNDSGYLTNYTETDPTVPSWAKASTKPTYTKSEVGLGNVDNVKQYSASNPPPYPVTKVNNKTGAVTLSASDVGALPNTTKIPTKVSDLTNDSGFITSAPDEIYVGDGDMPEGATIQIIMDGVNEEQALKDDLIEYIDSELELAKEDIIVQVYDLIKNNGVVGFVDENNTIIFSGKLTADSYTVKYKMEDGSTVDIGELVLDTNVYYSVTKNLTNCTINNSVTSVVEGESYSAIIIANDGYEISSVNVTMGGAPVSISGGTINIANVTGNIVITAEAEEASDNLLPNAINTDGTPYVGDNGEKGYRVGYRIKSTGLEEAASGATCSGFMPVTINSKIYIKPITPTTTATHTAIALYDTDKSKLMQSAFAESGYAWVTVENGVWCFTVNTMTTNSNVSYFRFSCASITDETIVTVDKPIV